MPEDSSEKKVWFLSSLINTTCAFVFRIDLNFNYTYVNDIYNESLNYSGNELIGANISKIVYPGDIAIIRRTISEAIKNPGEVYHIKHRKVAKNGLVRWVSTDAVAVKDEHDNIIREIQGISIDITDQQAAQHEALWNKNNLETLINNTEDLIWSIDLNKKYVFVNTAFRRWIKQVYNIEPGEGIVVNDAGFFPKSVVTEWNKYYDKALTGDTFSVNYQEINPITNQIVDFQISFNAIKDHNGNIIGVGCFARDNSENLSNQRSLLEQNEKLKNIASLSSHELRRPAAAILGLVDVFDRKNAANPENVKIIDHLKTVSLELDAVIRLIVNKTFIP